jgi:hypothetical protein
MTTGKHIGKVLVQIRPEEDSRVVVPVPRLMQAYPRYFCNPHYSYIIAGTGQSYTVLPDSNKAHTRLPSHNDLLDLIEFVECSSIDMWFWNVSSNVFVWSFFIMATPMQPV